MTNPITSETTLKVYTRWRVEVFPEVFVDQLARPHVWVRWWMFVFFGWRFRRITP